MKIKNSTTGTSVAVTLLLSVGATITLILVATGILASMILNENLQMRSAGIVIKIVLLLSVFAGMKIISFSQKQTISVTAGIYAVSIILIWLIVGLLFKTAVHNLLPNTLFILLGIGAGLVPGISKGKKHKYRKKRYR